MENNIGFTAQQAAVLTESGIEARKVVELRRVYQEISAAAAEGKYYAYVITSESWRKFCEETIRHLSDNGFTLQVREATPHGEYGMHINWERL